MNKISDERYICVLFKKYITSKHFYKLAVGMKIVGKKFTKFYLNL